MEKAQSRRHLLYALVSFACPVVAFLFMLAYQSIAHAEDWINLEAEADETLAAAFLFLAEIVWFAFAILVGTFVGIIFAIFSRRLGKRGLSLGTAAFAFNVLSFLAVLFFILRGMTLGF